MDSAFSIPTSAFALLPLAALRPRLPDLLVGTIPVPQQRPAVDRGFEVGALPGDEGAVGARRVGYLGAQFELRDAGLSAGLVLRVARRRAAAHHAQRLVRQLLGRLVEHA